MYTVVYYGQHSCNSKDDHNDDGGGANSSRPVDDDDSETIKTRSSSDSQSSSSSMSSITCCADARGRGGGHQIIDQAFLPHDSKPIVDDDESAEELPFDVAAFAPLDFDSWELDALLRFGA